MTTETKHLIYGIRLAHDNTHEYRYVGLTTGGARRFTDHMREYKKPSNKPLYCWMKKHFGNVEFDILETSSSEKLLPLLEMKWIHVLRLRGHRLLNVTDGGYGKSGSGLEYLPEGYTRPSKSPASPETRARMRKAKLGVPRTEETKLKISEFNRGKIISEEHKARLSELKRGEGNPMYGKKPWNSGKRMSDLVEDYTHPNKGKTYSDEHRRKLSEIHTGNPNRGRHTRWHTNRGIVDSNCEFCVTFG